MGRARNACGRRVGPRAGGRLWRTPSGRYFGVTHQQSIVLSVLLKRPEATKEQLHQAIERERPEDKEKTHIKLVDVLICILRRKLKPFGFAIKTMWGTGYLMEAKDRAKADGLTIAKPPDRLERAIARGVRAQER